MTVIGRPVLQDDPNHTHVVPRGSHTPFHYYLGDALKCDDLYDQVDADPLRGLPLLAIFGEHNDPLGSSHYVQGFSLMLFGLLFPRKSLPDVRRPRPRGQHNSFVASRARSITQLRPSGRSQKER
jgi:hypothetical protein